MTSFKTVKEKREGGGMKFWDQRKKDTILYLEELPFKHSFRYKDRKDLMKVNFQFKRKRSPFRDCES